MTDAQTINPRLVHFGIDWITATALGGSLSEQLFEMGDWLLREAVTIGNQKRPWSMSGFHGYKAGSCQMGTRDEEVIVRLSSDLAHDYWREVYDRADNCTRLDVQATYALNCEVGPVICRHFQQAKRALENCRRAPTISVLSTNNGPSTLYFNRRVSEQFGRIYDKGAESKLDHLQRCIRYEVELKGSRARSASASLRAHPTAELAAGATAVEFFGARGVRLGKSGICSDRSSS